MLGGGFPQSIKNSNFFFLILIKNKDFLKLCFNPELSTEISLQPLKRFDLDAAIIFSDILTVPYGLNQNVNFIKGEGPTLEDLDLHKVLNTTISNFSEKLKPSYNAIKLLKKINLKTEKHNINQNNMIIGEVVGIYIDDKFIIKDKINSLAMRTISRMGYSEYSEVNLKFMMTPPKWK